MFLPFENISSESRIWIFSSSIKISEDSQKDISEIIIKFLNSWKHHGVDLPCSFKILDNFFIIIALDQSNNSAGGCSIDQMFNCISDIDQQFDLSLLNRSKMHFFLLITKFYAIRWRKSMLNFLITCFLIKLLIKKTA